MHTQVFNDLCYRVSYDIFLAEEVGDVVAMKFGQYVQCDSFGAWPRSPQQGLS